MAGQDSQDKQLPASARRLQRAREDGQVVRSRDLSHFAAVAVGVAALVAVAPQATAALRDLVSSGLRFDAATITSTGAMGQRAQALAAPMLLAIVAMGAVMALVSVATSLLAGGWVWTFKTMAPDFSRFNPITGLPRLFSKQQLTDTMKACVLATALALVGGFYLKAHLDDFARVQAMPLVQGFGAVAQVVLAGLWLLVLVLAVFAALDVPLQRFMHASRLKMSRQELKDEYKEVEGNAEIKAKLRSRMREIVKRRMLAAVPKADLVVMNPTHYAVALKYDEATMNAPRIVAKGADLLALKIRDIARDAQVPVLQAPPLARALYAHGELDREVPMALFSAVAQVLAYVYQLRAALAGRAPQPGDLPPLAVPDELDPHHGQPAGAAE